MTTIPKVDVHHHIIPPEITNVSYGLDKMKVPEWTLSADQAFGKSINVQTRIFSVSVPGVSHIKDPETAAATARSINEYCARLRDADPTSTGFFATVPSLVDTELALREIRYALDVLKADGITFFTHYGDADSHGYLGNDKFVPLWEELNARGAVVFVHPCDKGNVESFNKSIAMAGFDWPHETGRTAMDMILNRRLLQFPDVKIILSHAGGTLPTLATRATIVECPEFGNVMTADEILGQAKRFYFDLALAGSPEVLPLILGFAPKGHILFGSDFPHATVPFSNRFTNFADTYKMDDDMKKEIYHGAAEKLFPRLKGLYEV
ncbi:amidohydrolase family protein [Xylariales sp. PMI_506]|nr:amidohydrolase family protein [Xylariales sp. PMI_506]